MPEMPDVVTLTTISSNWGNQIRDRTIQRYSSVANRTTEHGSPAEGDLSYLEDTNTVWVYDGSAWALLGPNLEVDGSTEVTGTVALSGAGVLVATVNLTIPATWGGWKCEAYATMVLNGVSGSSLNVMIRIDGTDQGLLTPAANYSGPAAVGGRRTGMTTTGSRAISLRGVQSSGGTVTNTFLYARAVRTS